MNHYLAILLIAVLCAVLCLFLYYTISFIRYINRPSIRELNLQNSVLYKNYTIYEIVRKASIEQIIAEVMQEMETNYYSDLCLTPNEINKIRATESDYFVKDSIMSIFVKKEFDNIVVETQHLGLEKQKKLNYYKSFFKTQNAHILVFVPKQIES